MKRPTIFVLVGLVAAFVVVRELGWLRSSASLTLASGCPQIARGAISLPDDHADDLAAILNAADVLNHQGTCVIEGGWGKDSRMYYLTVQERGANRPEIRRFHGDDLRKLASLGRR